MNDTPSNDLETVLREGMVGRASPGEFHVALLDATLFVPSATEIAPDGADYTPLVLTKPGSTAGMVVAFTAADRITPEARERAPYIFEVRGSRLVAHLPPGHGLLVFAGPDAAAEIDSATLGAMRGLLTRDA